MAEPVTSIGTAIAALGLAAKLAGLGLFVLIGANSYASMEYKKQRELGKKFGLLEYVGNIFNGIFSGSVFFIGSTILTDNDNIILLTSVLGAFLGIKGVTRLGDILLKLIEKRLGGEPDDTK